MAIPLRAAARLVGLTRRSRRKTEKGKMTFLGREPEQRQLVFPPDTHQRLFQALSEGLTLPSYLRSQVLAVSVGKDKGISS